MADDGAGFVELPPDGRSAWFITPGERAVVLDSLDPPDTRQLPALPALAALGLCAVHCLTDEAADRLRAAPNPLAALALRVPVPVRGTALLGPWWPGEAGPLVLDLLAGCESGAGDLDAAIRDAVVAWRRADTSPGPSDDDGDKGGEAPPS